MRADAKVYIFMYRGLPVLVDGSLKHGLITIRKHYDISRSAPDRKTILNHFKTHDLLDYPLRKESPIMVYRRNLQEITLPRKISLKDKED